MTPANQKQKVFSLDIPYGYSPGPISILIFESLKYLYSFFKDPSSNSSNSQKDALHMYATNTQIYCKEIQLRGKKIQQSIHFTSLTNDTAHSSSLVWSKNLKTIRQSSQRSAMLVAKFKGDE